MKFILCVNWSRLPDEPDAPRASLTLIRTDAEAARFSSDAIHEEHGHGGGDRRSPATNQ
jgi:hypothetical protein